MDFEKVDESKLNQLIMMEEFRLWDAKRNKVPETILDEIRLAIKELKEAKLKKAQGKSDKIRH